MQIIETHDRGIFSGTTLVNGMLSRQRMLYLDFYVTDNYGDLVRIWIESPRIYAQQNHD